MGNIALASAAESTALSPPEADQLEITVFGPGYGEAVLVHLGSNAWIQIDSCVDTQSRVPAPASYLDSLGLNPAECVRLLVVTHWHDDHIRGISQSYQRYESARLVIPSAFAKDDFAAFVSQGKETMMRAGSGLSEISAVFRTAAGRESRMGPPRLAQANKRIRVFSASEIGGTDECEIWSLSPSDKEVLQFLAWVGAISPTYGSLRTRVPSPKKNDTAVVILIQLGQLSLLFGSDLEEIGDPHAGWQSIVLSDARPKQLVGVFKVAHHGSANGHLDDVWTQMLEREPIAVLTPFRRGSVSLPRTGDAERILSRASNSFITAIPRSRVTTTRRKPEVEKTLRESVGKLYLAESEPGRVTLRSGRQRGSPWTVTTAGGASHLRTMLAVAR